MIGLVRLALRRPYTSAVAAFIILLAGVDGDHPHDRGHLPDHRHPRGAGGLELQRPVRRRTWNGAWCWWPSAAYSQTVNGVEHIESTSVSGIGLIKVFFHPGIDIGAAIAQINGVDDTALRVMPPGMQPPNIIQFNASNVGVVQLTSSSKTMSEQEIVDYTQNFIRLRLFTIPGIIAERLVRRQAAADHRRHRPDAPGGQERVAERRGDGAANLQRHPARRHRPHRRAANTTSLTNSSPPNVAQFRNLPLVVRNGVTGDARRRRHRQRQLRQPDQHRPRQRRARHLHGGAAPRRCLHARPWWRRRAP